MRRLLNLDELSQRIKAVDLMILQLAHRRMQMAKQVGQFKRSERKSIVRADVEDRRIAETRTWAEAHGLNPHFAALLEYALIGESCKLQLIDLQETMLRERPESEDERYAELKSNLLMLTERWHRSYDTDYDKEYLATRQYQEFELELMQSEVGLLADTELMLDLGSANGRASFKLADAFDRIIGYDISQHMQARANELAAERGLHTRLTFECVDLEEGIPLADNSASFVLMNFGTASDVRAIGRIIEETRRVLKTGGRLFFSFYNREALVYRWELLPWPVGLAAVVNIHRDSLDVHSHNGTHDEIVPIYARAYTVAEVQKLFADRGFAPTILTHPTISAILPDTVFDGQPEVSEAVRNIDRSLVTQSMGAYIIATAEKI